MALQTLTDASLLQRFDKLVRTERKITHLVLQCIAEIDRRKLYLDKAYPNLFEYLTQAYGYSAGAAQRRISAARFLIEVPTVARKIEQGQIHLSQISLLAQTIKIAEKKFATKMDSETKLELLEKLENQNVFETQRILAEELKVEVKAPERTQVHADGSVTLSLTFTPEQYADWRRAEELAVHAVSSRHASALAHYLAKQEIRRRTEIHRPARTSVSRTSPAKFTNEVRGNKFDLTSDAEVNGAPAIASRKNASRNPRQIPPNQRKALLRNAACGYRDARTGKACGSRRYLQIDHIRPVSGGGSRSPENLQVLCGAHNRHRWSASRQGF